MLCWKVLENINLHIVCILSLFITIVIILYPFIVGSVINIAIFNLPMNKQKTLSF